MKNKKLTIIEVSDTQLNFLQGNQAEGVLNIYFSEPLATNEEVTVKAMAAKIKLKKVGKIEPLILVLPRRLFIFKNFYFPSQIDAEIRKMIGLQLQNATPYKEEEIVWQYMILEQSADGYSRVLLMAIHLDTIRKYLKLLSAHHLHPAVITLSSGGWVGWLKAHLGILPQPNGVHLIVQVEDSSTEICFCDLERFYFSRQLGFGIRDLASGNTAEFQKQIKLSLNAYLQEKMGPAVETVMIMAPEHSAKMIKDILKPLVTGSIVSLDPVSEPAKTRIQTSSLAPSALSLGMFALDFKTVSNFLPVNLQDSYDLKARLKKSLRLVGLIFITLLSLIAALGVEGYQKSVELNKIRQKISELSVARKAAEGQLQQWETLRKGIIGRAPVMELFDELDRLLPNDIVLSSIRLSGNGEVLLQGQTPNGLAVNRFQTALVGSSLLKNVTLQYATKRVTASGEVTHFLMTATIKAGLHQEGR